MPVKELAFISANEDEKSALQKMEKALNGTAGLPSSITSSLPRLVTPDGETLEIPTSVLQALQQAVNYMVHGKAFSMIPCDQLLSTQEAADFLHVSQPFFVQLLETGQLPYVEAEAQKFVHVSDLLEYKRRRSQGRRKFLAEMLEFSQERGIY
jgi:hypothetical protein